MERAVFDNPNGHYKSELNKVGSAFVPHWEETGRRFQSKAKSCLLRARNLNRLGMTEGAKNQFEDALVYRRVAEKCYREHADVLSKSR